MSSNAEQPALRFFLRIAFEAAYQIGLSLAGEKPQNSHSRPQKRMCPGGETLSPRGLQWGALRDELLLWLFYGFWKLKLGSQQYSEGKLSAPCRDSPSPLKQGG